MEMALNVPFFLQVHQFNLFSVKICSLRILGWINFQVL
jgi:hypothetical protein